MDIRYYADTDLQTRQPDGLFRVILDAKASWTENLTRTGWVHDDDRAGDVEEYGVRPVSEQQAQTIAQRVFGQKLTDPVNPWENPDPAPPAAPAPADQPPAADGGQPTPSPDAQGGGAADGGQPKPAPAAAAGQARPGGS